jgi:hypothetical protein
VVDWADWWAFCKVALGGTLLVVYQICAAEHDIFLFSEVTLALFPK